MKITEITNKKNGEKFISVEGEDFENVDPVEHYKSSFISTRMIMRGIPYEELKGIKEPSEKSKKIFFEANKDWIRQYAKWKRIKVPNKLFELLNSNKKKQQKALLKGLVLTPDILMSFILEAYEKYDFKLSQYTSEHQAKGFKDSEKPFAYQLLENGEIRKFGKTDLSDGQLKQAIKHRVVTIVKFIENGEYWHCFFTNFKSLNGEEVWLGKNQPHYHYISNLFNIEREEVIGQLMSPKYKLGNLPHLKLEEYGNQPK
ncbi:hypothetical protein LB465_01475 [Salegentibacter sp. LM13S]|uniref:hypothetical protein n=1 Tax=Salegentibacter lacus TaxID=2873599 RepID=UPI001CC9DB12|nr:hypothetical protein [Salegentibacter lacus]MBZ9629432.1 hypothetical protein [Salegentibacter lacus]